MPITLELPPEIEARLKAQARARGLRLDAYVADEKLRRGGSGTPSWVGNIEFVAG